MKYCRCKVAKPLLTRVPCLAAWADSYFIYRHVGLKRLKYP